MAMCTSGSLSICGTAGTNRSIATAVTNTTSGSLSTNSLCAGKSAPHCMREFYGYSETSISIAPNTVYPDWNFQVVLFCITASAGLAWCAYENASWVTPNNTMCGIGSGSIRFNVFENPDQNERTTTVCVTSSLPTCNVYIDQAGNEGEF